MVFFFQFIETSKHIKDFFFEKIQTEYYKKEIFFDFLKINFFFKLNFFFLPISIYPKKHFTNLGFNCLRLLGGGKKRKKKELHKTKKNKT
jgi:hypothetical protein